uniref:p53 DNA-binding domain-containing protein n=1 Tax=Anopheles quadriannulatus TaxID=34691 RepID=A0A182X8T0_ANOQN
MSYSPAPDDDAIIAEEDMFATGEGCSQISFLSSQLLEDHILGLDKTLNDSSATLALSQTSPGVDIALPSSLLQDVKGSLPSSLNPTGKYPSVDELCLADIHFTVIPSSTQGSGFIFSEQLQKLFLKTDSICSFDIACQLPTFLPPTGWYVRVMLVSLAPESQHESITRCHKHIAHDTGPEEIRKHVVRCKNEQHEYVGADNGPFFEDRYAVRVPLDDEVLCVKIMLQFVCQNTCFRLDQRRTGLVFTLENDQGNIWARRVVPVKICINYRRDMQNEQNSATNFLPTSCLTAGRSDAPGTSAVRRYKTGRPGKRLQRGGKLGPGGGSFNRADRTVPVRAARHIEPYTVNIEMPSLRMAKRVMDNAIGMISAQILLEDNTETKNRLKVFLDSIRGQREALAMSNSQCSVDLL